MSESARGLMSDRPSGECEVAIEGVWGLKGFEELVGVVVVKGMYF